MPDDAHAVLVFYGCIVGFIVIILCICCVVYYNRVRDTLRNQNVAPVILDEDEEVMVYTRMNKETSPLNGNSI